MCRQAVWTIIITPPFFPSSQPSPPPSLPLFYPFPVVPLSPNTFTYLALAPAVHHFFVFRLFFPPLCHFFLCALVAAFFCDAPTFSTRSPPDCTSPNLSCPEDHPASLSFRADLFPVLFLGHLPNASPKVLSQPPFLGRSQYPPAFVHLSAFKPTPLSRLGREFEGPPFFLTPFPLLKQHPPFEAIQFLISFPLFLPPPLAFRAESYLSF